MNERIVIVDFGGQYNQLIARRVREAGVFCELLPRTSSVEKIKGKVLSGIILTGGPDSVMGENARKAIPQIFELGVPILGICYGMQYIAHEFKGVIGRGKKREYGRTTAYFTEHPLFEGLDDNTVWMNHNDSVFELPSGFESIAHTDNCAVAAFANEEKKIYGFQFHPEVNQCKNGTRMIKNFLKNICNLKCDWKIENFTEELIASIVEQVGDGRVIAGLSGGVDSSVASALVHRAIGDRLTCIFVDHGLLRKNEAEEVLAFYAKEFGLNIKHVDAKKRFLDKLKGVTDPETKRKIIGEEFVRVFEEEALMLGGADFLLQGTIYSDVIESGHHGSAVIKSHHNVGGLPKNISFKGLLEPLRTLFKDEVRQLGEALGIPHELVWRQPFPGPGLAIRVKGEVTEERLEIVRESDAILREEVAKAGLEHDIWQYFTVFTGVQSVGVKGDERSYDYCVAVRAVNSSDAMTVEWAHLPYELLMRVSERIIGEIESVNRVVYDITAKPPGTIEWE
ncbi:MAG: glutamine-hydrolyzing GMP synthase [Clostridiales bacterium]|jgi:GMP synthase (glutamine-hydrolysing)|nr:glutamine-hydrolyzing GMP synthase [Clostridiales bacterium]